MALASLALVALLRRPALARRLFRTDADHEAAAGESPLVKHLKTIIRVSPSASALWSPTAQQLHDGVARRAVGGEQFRGGPISVAEYMEEVLTNPRHGFYMKRDVFGAAGDFVTSPDVSQMF
eukprot:SM006160S20097  [mRNA]  locus=s6160:287:770:- [translate_table: standard]